MNKEMSRSPPKHEFLLNPSNSSPMSVDHFDFLSLQPLSKDSVTEGDDQISLHNDRIATTTDHTSSKNLSIATYSSHGKKSHSKKKSAEYQKDAVTYLLSNPSSTTNAKATNKNSQIRTIPRSNTAHHLNFLNSKEFAKFALSKVLPKEIKKEKPKHLELSPQQRRSQAGSLEKSPPKSFYKEDTSLQQKYNPFNTKKQKGKLRASNSTYTEFSSLADQSRQIHSFMNSPQKKSSLQTSTSYTKSTTNLRPMSTKNQNQMPKNAWLQASNEAFRKIESSLGPKTTTAYDDVRAKDRTKGTQSVASILNLRRDKKVSPEKNANSCYLASNYHRKVASIGCRGQNNSRSNNSMNQSQSIQPPISHIVSIQEDHKNSMQRSPSQGLKVSNNSPLKRDPSVGNGKQKGEETIKFNGVYSEHFADLQQTFGYLLEKYKSDVENVQETYTMLKQIKQAYEVFITEILTKLMNKSDKTDPPKASSLEKELRAKCETLLTDKKMLEEELKYLRNENQKLYTIVNNNKEREEVVIIRDNQKSETVTKAVSRGPDMINTGPAGMSHSSSQKLGSNNDDLKVLIANQQNIIRILQNKEAKLMQLLYNIHKQGFDVEKLLREEAQMDSENSVHLIPVSSKINLETESGSRNNILDASDGIDICSLISSEDLSEIVSDYADLKPKYGISDAKTTDSTPYITNNANKLKNKLRLDFRGISNSHKALKLPLGVNNTGQQFNNAEQIGFHEEFMARIDEFSPSWRHEALNQRNF